MVRTICRVSKPGDIRVNLAIKPSNLFRAEKSFNDNDTVVSKGLDDLVRASTERHPLDMSL
jgi:hypothetical protein